MKKYNYKPIWVNQKIHLKVKKESVKKKITMGELIESLIKKNENIT